MESEYLIDCNRPALKELFFNILAENETPFVSFTQFITFCIKVKVYPEFISLSELKRTLCMTLKKSIIDDKQLEITYLQFEKLIKAVSEHCFPTGNSLKHLFSHIKSPCKHLYSILLTTVPPIQNTYEPIKHPKVPNTARNKNISMTHRKILNTSASQKISTTKVEPLKSPRDRTLLNLKLFQQKNPGLRIIQLQNKIRDEKKVDKLTEVCVRFKNTHLAIMKSSKGKRLVARFVERFLESKMKVVLGI